MTDAEHGNQQPSRYRKTRSDASIETIQRTTEGKFGLPTGCVKLVNPTGRKIRSDATIETLISNWRKGANKALQPTANPLRGLSAAELGR